MTNLDELLAHDDTGDGPPIVFIHGLTFSKETWRPIIERLRDRFRCFAVDLPGHGDSTGSGADPRVTCSRVHATCAAAGIARPVVVGHSAGALIATGYAGLYPTAGVVNVDQPLHVEPFAHFVQHFADALRGPDFAAAFAPFQNTIGVDRLPEPERTRVQATQRIDAQVVLDHWTGPLTTAPAALQAEIDELLDRVDVPYLLLTGETIAPPDRALLFAHVPSAAIEQWPGNGHLVHLAEPDRFAARLARFVEQATEGRLVPEEVR